jgi:hypothetical protein
VFGIILWQKDVVGGVYQGAWSFDFPHTKHRVIDGGASFEHLTVTLSVTAFRRNSDGAAGRCNRTPAPANMFPFAT